jgi:uncharacterized protein
VSSDISNRLRALLAHAPEEIVAAYLFGSEARGSARSDSDADLALLFAAAPARTLGSQPFRLADDLSGALGRRVEVVVLNTAPADLVHRVLRDGELLLERDRSARVRFEVAARNVYFDMKPHLDRYRRTA